MAIISGTTGNDTRIGTRFHDTITTGNGNDLIFAVQGNDTVFGGNGNDTAWGGDGSDWLYGAAGRDSLFGDAAGDRLDGGNDNDILIGGTGDDTVWGGNGADNLWGGDNNDSVYGGLGNDRVGGGSGDDLLQGAAGNDSLRGLDGFDTAVFSGARAGYTVREVDGVIVVTDINTTNGNDGTDRLSDVERLRFADESVRLDPYDLDIYVGRQNAEQQALFNQGGGQFLFTTVGQGFSVQNFGVALGDLDGDGDVDGIVGNFNFGPSKIVINQGGKQGGTEGTFEASDAPGGVANTWGVALGDVDADGDLDAILGVQGTGDGVGSNNRLLVNQGGDQGGTAGTFVSEDLPGGTPDSMGVALGDLDGDDDLDALVVNRFQAPLLLANDGEGNFTASYLPVSDGSGLSVALGDFDADGDLDALLGNADLRFPSSGVTNQILVNQGGDQGGNEGDFLAEDAPGGARISCSVAVGDLDGDGDLDALVGNGLGLVYLVNQGGRQGGTEGAFVGVGGSTADSVTSVPLADLDGDGTMGLTPSGLPIVGAGVPIVADLEYLFT